jgi:hypothetical protein
MAVEIPRSLVEYILLGPTNDRRQLQDSPILADVWIAFARNAAARLNLLITPIRERTAGEVAVAITRGWTAAARTRTSGKGRPRWSPRTTGCRRSSPACPSPRGHRVEAITHDTAPHVIDLLDPL